MSNEESFLSKVKHYRKEIIVGVLILMILVFMIQNAHDVEFNLIFTDMHVPLIVLILGFAGLGASIVGIYWALSNRDKKRTIKDQKAQLAKFEKIMANIKTDPTPTPSQDSTEE